MKDFYRVCLEKIKSHRADIADTLTSGSIKKHSEYRYFCGYLRGLEDADAIVRDVYGDFLKSESNSTHHMD